MGPAATARVLGCVLVGLSVALAVTAAPVAATAGAAVARPGPDDVPACAGDFVVRMVRLAYADAEELALTLGWVAPPGIRIAPYRPTNSLLISGPAADVDRMLDLLGRR